MSVCFRGADNDDIRTLFISEARFGEAVNDEMVRETERQQILHGPVVITLLLRLSADGFPIIAVRSHVLFGQRDKTGMLGGKNEDALVCQELADTGEKSGEIGDIH